MLVLNTFFTVGSAMHTGGMGDPNPDIDDSLTSSFGSQSMAVRKLAGLSSINQRAGSGPVKPPALPLWLEAWSDPVAGIQAYTPCIHTCNLFGDGDWRLVAADADRKLKVI